MTRIDMKEFMTKYKSNCMLEYCVSFLNIIFVVLRIQLRINQSTRIPIRIFKRQFFGVIEQRLCFMRIKACIRIYQII